MYVGTGGWVGGLVRRRVGGWVGRWVGVRVAVRANWLVDVWVAERRGGIAFAGGASRVRNGFVPCGGDTSATTTTTTTTAATISSADRTNEGKRLWTFLFDAHIFLELGVSHEAPHVELLRVGAELRLVHLGQDLVAAQHVALPDLEGFPDKNMV